jgi:alpha-L-fucosidase 2
LRDRGGYEVGLEWVDGRVSRATIVAAVGGKCRVRSAHPLTVSSQGRAISATRPEPGVLEFQTNAGSTYVLSAATNPVR